MFLTHWLRTRARVARPSTPRPRFRPRVEAMEDRSLPSGGVLDPTFGTAGVVSTDFGATIDNIRSVAVGADGTIVAAGVTFQGRGNGTASDFALARYLPDGTPDGSFGTGGKVTTVVAGGSVSNNLTGVAVQPDRKILAAGGCKDDFALVRYNLNGSIDTSFGGAAKGKVLTDVNGRSLDAAMAMTVQSDGRILLAGTTARQNTTYYDLALVRYTTAGLLDTTFSQDGKATLHLPWSVTTSLDSMEMVVYPPGAGALAGKIVVATGGDHVFRFNADGGLDTSFGGGSGYVTFSGTAGGSNVALQPDGRIVLARSAGGSPDIKLTRLQPDGSPDVSFGDGGSVWTVLPTAEYVHSVAVQANGQILVGGRQFVSADSSDRFFVARYGASGVMDTSFGDGGVATTSDLHLISRPVGMALQPDGRIVVAGTSTISSSNQDFVVARFLETGPQVGSFTASPNPVAAGDPLTLTAGGVTARNPGSTVTRVAFYQDSNGDGVLDRDTDLLLGYGVQTSPGTWTLTFSTSALPPGTYTFFAAAEDSYGAFGDPLGLMAAVG